MQAGHGQKYNRKQNDAIMALLISKTVEDAAKKVGVAPSTLYRWLAETEFKRAYSNARAKCLSYAIGRLQYAAMDAVSLLHSIIIDSEAPAHLRVIASRTVLDLSFRGTELDDLANRVDEIENYLADK